MEHEFSRILVIQRDRTSKSCGARILQDSSNPKRSHLNGTKKQGARISLKKILRDCHVVCFINCLGHKFSRDQSNPKRLYLSAITCYNCSFQNISYQKVVYRLFMTYLPFCCNLLVALSSSSVEATSLLPLWQLDRENREPEMTIIQLKFQRDELPVQLGKLGKNAPQLMSQPTIAMSLLQEAD